MVTHNHTASVRRSRGGLSLVHSSETPEERQPIPFEGNLDAPITPLEIDLVCTAIKKLMRARNPRSSFMSGEVTRRALHMDFGMINPSIQSRCFVGDTGISASIGIGGERLNLKRDTIVELNSATNDARRYRQDAVFSYVDGEGGWRPENQTYDTLSAGAVVTAFSMLADTVQYPRDYWQELPDLSTPDYIVGVTELELPVRG